MKKWKEAGKLVCMLAMVVLFGFFAVRPASAAGTVSLAGKVRQGEDITAALNDALREAQEKATDTNPYTVIVPQGSYVISSVLHIYSNTVLNATGATLTYENPDKESHNLILSGDIDYNKSYRCAGYGGYRNIAVIGGTWVSSDYNTASMVKLMHAQNVLLQGATFQGGGSVHQVEVCAIDGFRVLNCTFCDLPRRDTSNKQEALQLDMPCSVKTYKDTWLDGTPMRNVEISGCTFRNVPRGLGTHSQLVGAYHENIVIKNNTFTNLSEEAIVTVDYYNCQITGNKIKNCGAGILIQTCKKSPSTMFTSVQNGTYQRVKKKNLKTTVSNNTIALKYSAYCDDIMGIKVYGQKFSSPAKGGDGRTIAKGDYRARGVKIVNNSITTAGHGIETAGAVGTVIQKNKITGKGYSGSDPKKGTYKGILLTTESADASIISNTVKKVSGNGIYLMTGSTAKTISKNTVTACGMRGIGLYDGCKMTGDISGNKISKCGEVGISISTKCSVGTISGNVITNSGGDGISVYQDSVVRKNISGNVMKDTDMGSHGIFVNDAQVKGSILNNQILKVKNRYSCTNGILLYNGSVVKGKIKSNKINNAGKNGIALNTKCKSGSITGNKISKPANCGVQVYDSSTVKGDVSKNKITKPGKAAVKTSVNGKITGKCSSNE